MLRFIKTDLQKRNLLNAFQFSKNCQIYLKAYNLDANASYIPDQYDNPKIQLNKNSYIDRGICRQIVHYIKGSID